MDSTPLQAEATAGAPGNMILMGEYAVLEGSRAVLMTLGCRLSVRVAPSDVFRVTSDRFGEYVEGMDVPPHVALCRSVVDILNSVIPAKAGIHCAVGNMGPRLRGGDGLNITITSTIPPTYGFGSSAALVAALVRALFRLHGREEVFKDMFEVGHAAILKTFARGSGADLAAALADVPFVVFDPVKKSAVPFDMPFIVQAVYTGYKTPTPEVLKQIEKEVPREKWRAIVEKMKTCAEGFISAPSAVRILEYQKLMEDMGVACDRCRQAVAAFGAQGVAAKISGSGLGDCVVGFSERSVDIKVEKPLEFLPEGNLKFPLSPRTSRVGEGRGEGGGEVRINLASLTRSSPPPPPPIAARWAPRRSCHLGMIDPTTPCGRGGEGKHGYVSLLLGPLHRQKAKHNAAEAFMPSNIALVKYWGKRPGALNLPLVSSLSYTLDGYGTKTRISLASADSMRMNGIELPFGDEAFVKVRAFLDLFRADDEQYRIETDNNIPTAAGVASSASGFAALTAALVRLKGGEVPLKTQSMLARLGSGSAARSFWPGLVLWHKGVRADGADCYAEPAGLPVPSFAMVVLVLDREKKKWSSGEAMRISLATSPLAREWPERQEKHLEAALHAKSFDELGGTAEENAVLLHDLLAGASPSIVFGSAATEEWKRRVRDWRAGGLPVYFTQDAGANLKLLFPREAKREIEEKLGREGIDYFMV